MRYLRLGKKDPKIFFHQMHLLIQFESQGNFLKKKHSTQLHLLFQSESQGSLKKTFTCRDHLQYYLEVSKDYLTINIKV
jgi:hypothetical protein